MIISEFDSGGGEALAGGPGPLQQRPFVGLLLIKDRAATAFARVEDEGHVALRHFVAEFRQEGVL